MAKEPMADRLREAALDLVLSKTDIFMTPDRFPERANDRAALAVRQYKQILKYTLAADLMERLHTKLLASFTPDELPAGSIIYLRGCALGRTRNNRVVITDGNTFQKLGQPIDVEPTQEQLQALLSFIEKMDMLVSDSDSDCDSDEQEVIPDEQSESGPLAEGPRSE